METGGGSGCGGHWLGLWGLGCRWPVGGLVDVEMSSCFENGHLINGFVLVLSMFCQIFDNLIQFWIHIFDI